jgi:hypothetical protein
MSDAFDQLERQLRRAVRAAADNVPVRRRRGWRRTSVFAVAAALTVSGGALAATKLVGGQSAETQGRKIAAQAIRDTATLPACAPAVASQTLVLSDSAPLPEIRAALPALATPAPRDNQARALSMLPQGGPAGPVLRRTVRAIPAPDGVTLVVYVQQGFGFGALRDPDACGQARRERAAVLDKDRAEDVKRWTERRLAEVADTVRGLQTLNVLARVHGQAGLPGAGTPVRPGQPLRLGLLLSGGAGGHRSVYVGIAGPRASEVRVRAQLTRGVPERVAVRQGFYAVVLPARTGSVHLQEVTATGTTLRVLTLRDRPHRPAVHQQHAHPRTALPRRTARTS